MSDFKPTVDLRDKMNNEPRREPQPKISSLPPTRPSTFAKATADKSGTPPASLREAFRAGPSRAGVETKQLPKELEVEDKQTFQKINRPALRQAPFGLSSGQGQGRRRDVYKVIVAVVVLMAAAVGGYWFWYKPWQAATADPPAKWYMVKLTNGETFYGQIKNTGGDPVVIENVYYDYDQLNNPSAGSGQGATEQRQEAPAGQIRLVKRGKETHGPSGSLDIVRLQVLYMEPLADDSKVLRAIIDYEKK